MEKKALKRLTALGLASLLLSGTVFSQTVHAEDNQPIAQFRVHKDGSQSIVGKTTPNTRLRIDYNGTIEAVSDSEGNYELKIPEDKKYENSPNISLYSVDSENNVTYIAGIRADTVAPGVDGDIWLEVGDTQLSSYVYDDYLENVTLRINDKIYPGEKVEERTWNFKFPEVSEGDTVTLTATDKTGNVTEKTAIVRGLEAPRAGLIVNSDDTIQLIEGRTYPNATVHVLLPNKRELTTTSNDNGEFTLKLTDENWFYEDEGEAQIWVVRQGGVSSSITKVKGISGNYNTIAGWYEFRVEEDGSQILKFDGANYSSQKITLILPNGEILHPSKDKNGTQQIIFPKNKGLKHGQPVKVLFRSKDGKVARTIIPDVEAPAIPVVNKINVGDSVIGGTAEKDKELPSVENGMYNVSLGVGDVLIVTLPDGKIRTVSPDQYGNWILSIPTVKNGDIITVRAKDFVGNISEPRIIKVGSSEVKSTHETGQANIQAEFPEFPLKDVPEVDKTTPSKDDKKPQLGSSQNPVITGKGESTVQEDLPEFPVELVPTLTGHQPRPTNQNPSNNNLGQGSQGLQNSGKQEQKPVTNKKAILPKTGETASTLAFLAGLVVMGLAFLGLKGRRG